MELGEIYKAKLEYENLEKEVVGLLVEIHNEGSIGLLLDKNYKEIMVLKEELTLFPKEDVPKKLIKQLDVVSEIRIAEYEIKLKEQSLEKKRTDFKEKFSELKIQLN